MCNQINNKQLSGIAFPIKSTPLIINSTQETNNEVHNNSTIHNTIESVIAQSTQYTQSIQNSNNYLNNKIEMLENLQKESTLENTQENLVLNSTKYSLEEVLSFISKNINSNNKKTVINKVLRKIVRLRFLSRNKNFYLPIYSAKLENQIQLILERIKLSEQNKLEKLELKRIKALELKPYIEYNLKAKYISPLNVLKNTDSAAYKSLNKQEKEWIKTLLFLDTNNSPILNTNDKIVQINNLNKNNSKLNTNITNNNSNNIIFSDNNVVITTKDILNNLTNYSDNIFSSKNIMYSFNNRNSYRIFKNKKTLFNLVQSAFRTMTSFISTPYYILTPKVLTINIFYYWRPFYVMEKLISTSFFNKIIKTKKYNRSVKFSKFNLYFNHIIEYISHLITRLVKKSTKINFIRTYYPHNNSNIFAFFVGSLSFLVKYNKMLRKIFFKLNLLMNKNKMAKLQYSNIPATISGIEINFAGRVFSNKAKNRVKDKNKIFGSLARKNRFVKSHSNFVSKTKGGAFNVLINNKSTFVV